MTDITEEMEVLEQYKIGGKDYVLCKFYDASPSLSPPGTIQISFPASEVYDRFEVLMISVYYEPAGIADQISLIRVDGGEQIPLWGAVPTALTNGECAYSTFPDGKVIINGNSIIYSYIASTAPTKIVFSALGRRVFAK